MPDALQFDRHVKQFAFVVFSLIIIVCLTITAGCQDSADSLVKVPDFKGLTGTQARFIGIFHVVKVLLDRPEYPLGTEIAVKQDPLAGTKIPAGGTITVEMGDQYFQGNREADEYRIEMAEDVTKQCRSAGLPVLDSMIYISQARALLTSARSTEDLSGIESYCDKAIALCNERLTAAGILTGGDDPGEAVGRIIALVRSGDYPGASTYMKDQALLAPVVEALSDSGDAHAGEVMLADGHDGGVEVFLHSDSTTPLMDLGVWRTNYCPEKWKIDGIFLTRPADDAEESKAAGAKELVREILDSIQSGELDAVRASFDDCEDKESFDKVVQTVGQDGGLHIGSIKEGGTYVEVMSENRRGGPVMTFYMMDLGPKYGGWMVYRVNTR